MFPALSIALIGNVPGGVTVGTDPIVVHTVVVVPVQIGGMHVWNGQLLQSVVVDWLCQVKGEVPPETVMSPFVSLQTDNAAQALTVMVVESFPQASV